MTLIGRVNVAKCVVQKNGHIIAKRFHYINFRHQDTGTTHRCVVSKITGFVV